MVIIQGLVGPKGMAKAVPDGHGVNIPQPAYGRWSDAENKLARLIGLASASLDWYSWKIRNTAFNGNFHETRRTLGFGQAGC